MDVRDYLNQGYLLSQKIASDEAMLQELRERSMSVSAVSYGERLFKSDNRNAGFVRVLNKIDDVTVQVQKEIELLIQLKKQIWCVINTAPTLREQMVLQYRHIENKCWEEIGDMLKVNEKTARRWYRDALEKITLPEHPMDLDKILQKTEEN